MTVPVRLHHRMQCCCTQTVFRTFFGLTKLLIFSKIDIFKLMIFGENLDIFVTLLHLKDSLCLSTLPGGRRPDVESDLWGKLIDLITHPKWFAVPTRPREQSPHSSALLKNRKFQKKSLKLMIFGGNPILQV